MTTGQDKKRETRAFEPVERIEGQRQALALVVCDHARNAFPPGYDELGLPPEALERHIAYDIGAAWVARRLAERLGAPALLSTFSRLLIDPNRGADDPTLVMRYSDGAIVPGNAHADAEEIERRRRLYWAPYRDAVDKGPRSEIPLASMIKFYGRKNAATEPVRGSTTIEAPPVEQVLRPKLMVSQSGKPVSVKKWTPKGSG